MQYQLEIGSTLTGITIPQSIASDRANTIYTGNTNYPYAISGYEDGQSGYWVYDPNHTLVGKPINVLTNTSNPMGVWDPRIQTQYPKFWDDWYDGWQFQTKLPPSNTPNVDTSKQLNNVKPYARPITIDLHATHLAPLTEMFVFINDIMVNAYIVKAANPTGAIQYACIANTGYQYSNQTYISFSGNSSRIAVAKPVIANNSIVDIEFSDPGAGYLTYAINIVDPNNTGHGANVSISTAFVSGSSLYTDINGILSCTLLLPNTTDLKIPVGDLTISVSNNPVLPKRGSSYASQIFSVLPSTSVLAQAKPSTAAIDHYQVTSTDFIESNGNIPQVVSQGNYTPLSNALRVMSGANSWYQYVSSGVKIGDVLPTVTATECSASAQGPSFNGYAATWQSTNISVSSVTMDNSGLIYFYTPVSGYGAEGLYFITLTAPPGMYFNQESINGLWWTPNFQNNGEYTLAANTYYYTSVIGSPGGGSNVLQGNQTSSTTTLRSQTPLGAFPTTGKHQVGTYSIAQPPMLSADGKTFTFQAAVIVGSGGDVISFKANNAFGQIQAFKDPKDVTTFGKIQFVNGNLDGTGAIANTNVLIDNINPNSTPYNTDPSVQYLVSTVKKLQSSTTPLDPTNLPYMPLTMDPSLFASTSAKTDNYQAVFNGTYDSTVAGIIQNISNYNINQINNKKATMTTSLQNIFKNSSGFTGTDISTLNKYIVNMNFATSSYEVGNLTSTFISYLSGISSNLSAKTQTIAIQQVSAFAAVVNESLNPPK